MRYLILGALLGLMLVFPPLLALVVGITAGLAAKPVLVAFGLGLLARPYLRRPGRWTT